MPEPVDYSSYAGTVLFPRTPADLTSTSSCPACFTPISAAVCPTCGLNLGSPLASLVQSESTDAAAALARRFALIGRIRYESSLALAVADVARPAPVAAEPTPPPPPAATPAPVPAIPTAPRRSSVQVILLVVGVSLLSVAAIFFLVYAFINFGIIWRSVIIAAITLAAFAAASLLSRRGLTATAEGIAVFGVVLVYLDAFAVRANNLFGAASSEPWLYWGLTLLVSAVAFYVWHRASRLRVASIAAFAAVAPGILLSVAAIDAGSATPFLAFAAASVAGLVSPLTTKRVERSIVLSLSAIAWVLALCTSFLVEPAVAWAPGLAFVALAVVASAYVLVAHPTAWKRGWAVAGGVAAAASVGAGLVREGSAPVLTIVPALVAVVVAVALEVIGRRASRTVLLFAAAGAGSVAALLLTPALIIALRSVVVTLQFGVWDLAPTSRLLETSATDASAIAALAATVAVAAAGSLLARQRRGPALAWGTAVTLVLAAPLVGVLVLVQGVWLLLAAASVAAMILSRRFRAPLAVLAVGAAALGYWVSWASESTWLAASLTVVVLLFVARLATRAKPVLLAVAIAVTFIAAAALPEQLGSSDPRNSLHLVAAVGVLLLFAPFRAHDRRVAFWASLPVIGITAFGSQWSLSAELEPSQYVAALALAGGFVAALVVLVVRAEGFVVEKAAASVVLTIGVLWLLDSLFRLLDLAPFVLTCLPMAAAVLVSATSLVGPLRVWREVGVGMVAIPALFLAIAGAGVGNVDALWLVLLLAAVTALLVSLSRDGLVGSTSPRRHLGWLALALGIGSLWSRLALAGVQAIEPFVLPITGALLVVAVLLWRAKTASSVVVLGALLVSMVPIALAAATGSVVRASIIGVVSAVLLFGGTIRPRPHPYLDAAAISGAIAAVALALGRAANATDPDAATIDFWLAAAFAALAITAWGQSRARGDATDRARTIASQVIAVAAMLLVLVAELGLIGSPILGETRVVTLVVVLGAVHAASGLLDRAPFTAAVGWVALAFSGVVVIAGLLRATLDPIELATVPLAFALFAGALRSDRGSWVTTAPGLLVLLLPSLAATIDERPGWRLLGIGVVAIAAIVYGSVKRLQAPFVIGSVVVLVHAIATFAPQIRLAYLALPWWLWAGVGGVLLIVLAARYEHRIKNLRDAVGRLSAMR